jgi:predicted HicB family RNase H-like nuclease
MKNMLEYKDYFGSVQYSADDDIFYGKLEFIRDLVSYDGKDVNSLKKAFQEAVNDYLELCQEQKREPNIPFRGSFNVRTGSELHRKASVYAQENNITLNTLVTEALQMYLKH